MAEIDKAELKESIDEDRVVEIGEHGPIISPLRVYKNLGVISIAWILQFTAFQAISLLQSSLNQEGNVGVISLALVYVFMVISSILLPKPMITIFGLKWTIAICQIPYLLYVLANVHPIAGLLYPAAILLGLAASPLWTSHSTYITQLGNVYAKRKSLNPDAKIAQFFGIFFMSFQTSQIWGNLISYFVLAPKVPLNMSTVNYSQCGPQYSPSKVNLTGGQADVAQKTRNILIGVYIGACILSMIVVILLLDQRKKQTNETLKETVLGSAKLLKSSLLHMRNTDQQCLIFITIWNGLQNSFIGAQFTQGIVTCAYGIHNIGLVFVCFGVCNAISSFVSGQIVAYINRRYLLTGAATLSVTVLVVLMTWTPGPKQLYVPFLLVVMWAIADAIYMPQMYAFYGIVCKSNLEPGYSNYRLWESIGFVIAYAYTPFLEVRYGSIILLVVLILGLIGFAIVDIRHNFPAVWTRVTGLEAPESAITEDSKEK